MTKEREIKEKVYNNLQELFGNNIIELNFNTNNVKVNNTKTKIKMLPNWEIKAMLAASDEENVIKQLTNFLAKKVSIQIYIQKLPKWSPYLETRNQWYRRAKTWYKDPDILKQIPELYLKLENN